MKQFALIALLAALLASAAPLKAEDLSEAEQDHLRTALSEAGSSPIEFVRALEDHLKKYPNSPKKNDLERALVKSAIEAKDNARIIKYGERVLARDPDDLLVLERVALALLNDNSAANSTKALKYAQAYEQGLKKIEEKARQEDPREQARLRDEIDHGFSTALIFQARATGNLGRAEEASALARKGFEVFPSAESAREVARWELQAGHVEQAVRHYAEAFTIADAKATDADRAKDRERMGAAWKKLHDSDKGLGDVVLEAYDRTRAIMNARRLKARELDPNAELTDPMQFTLSAVEGRPLNLASLRGKVVVMDFWATWCGPCRSQHPLYEEVKKRFAKRDDVVFLGINTDETRSLVVPFLKEQKWSGKNVYYEDGLSNSLRVSSIPTTAIADKKGNIVSRMNGYVPERFVDMLVERIERTLKEE